MDAVWQLNVQGKTCNNQYEEATIAFIYVAPAKALKASLGTCINALWVAVILSVVLINMPQG